MGVRPIGDVYLKDLGPADARDLNKLLSSQKKAKAMLEQLVPGGSKEYYGSQVLQRTVARHHGSQDVMDLGIYGDLGGERILMGLATLRLGKLSCGEQVVLENAASLSLLIGDEYRRKGLGRLAGAYALNVAETVFDHPNVGHITLVDAENTAGRCLAESAGYDELSAKNDYTFALEDPSAELNYQGAILYAHKL